MADDRGNAFASILYAEPGALGLIANIMSALVVAIENMLDPDQSAVALTVAGVHLIILGGFLQLLAGFMSYRRNDHLTGTAFIVFASLWAVMGVNRILFTTPLTVEILQVGILPGMVGFMGVSIILCICAMTVNYIMPPVLIAILLALIFEAVGLFFVWGRRVAAAFELIIALSGIYGVVVMTLKGVSQRYILPGFGNAPYDVLLIKTKSKSNRKIEKKKNTTYAEPMGMGYMGNVIPATILAFHHLGYFQDFRPAMSMFISSVFCHIFASYYAFLRHDYFHAVQFIIYFIFWMSKASVELLISAEVPGVDDLRINFFGLWGVILIMFVLLACSMCQSKVVYIYNVIFTIMVILSLEHIPRNVNNFTFGVPCAIVAVMSMYVSMAHLVNSVAEKTVMYVGGEVVTQEKMQQFFERWTTCDSSKTKKVEYKEEGPHVEGQIVDSISFVGSTVAGLCLSSLEATNGTMPFAWVVVAGAFMQLYAARLAYAAGSLAKTYILVVLGAFWVAWATLIMDGTCDYSLRAASVAILVLHTATMVLTVSFTRVWIPFSILMELNAIVLVARCFNTNPPYMVLVCSLLTGLIAFYGTFAGMINGVLQGIVVPVGTPIIQVRNQELEENEKNRCLSFPSRRTSALRVVAKILDNGGVVGVPTDTVYALAASCKHPKSIEKIYSIKGRPSTKPICVCLSNLDQLASANPPFSDLLWAFMRRCYPGGISCVVPKGPWLRNLGLEEAVEYIGTKDSVCIRVPDCSVLAYLTGLTGPVGITSANPSGEPDSTHHDMVLNSLGHKIDGMICDGHSSESMASTVVNCMNIDKGEIAFFRIGCTPQEIVEQKFEEAKAETRSKTITLDLDPKTQLGFRI